MPDYDAHLYLCLYMEYWNTHEHPSTSISFIVFNYEFLLNTQIIIIHNRGLCVVGCMAFSVCSSGIRDIYLKMFGLHSFRNINTVRTVVLRAKIAHVCRTNKT